LYRPSAGLSSSAAHLAHLVTDPESVLMWRKFELR
jgi:hypothetical protein